MKDQKQTYVVVKLTSSNHVYVDIWLAYFGAISTKKPIIPASQLIGSHEII